MRPLFAEHLPCWANTRAVDGAAQPAEGLESRVEGVLHAPFVGDVGVHEACFITDLGGDALPSLVVNVGDDDVRFGLGQQAGGRRPQARAAAADQERAVLYLHARFLLKSVVPAPSSLRPLRRA